MSFSFFIFSFSFFLSFPFTFFTSNFLSSTASFPCSFSYYSYFPPPPSYFLLRFLFLFFFFISFTFFSFSLFVFFSFPLLRFLLLLLLFFFPPCYFHAHSPAPAGPGQVLLPPVQGSRTAPRPRLPIPLMTPNSRPFCLKPRGARAHRSSPGGPAGVGKCPGEAAAGSRGAARRCSPAAGARRRGCPGKLVCFCCGGVCVFLSLNTQGKPAPSAPSSGSRAEGWLWSRACGHPGGMGREGWETTPTCPEKSSHWVSKAGRKTPGLFGRFSITSRPRAAGSRSPGG